MENFFLSIPIDAILHPVENGEECPVILSRRCALYELLNRIAELPTHGTIDVDEIKGISFDSGIVHGNFNASVLNSAVSGVSVVKRTYSTHFNILTTRSKVDTEPLKVSFKQTSPTGGDETAAYEAVFSRECTLNELVDLLLTHVNSWGAIYYHGHVVMEYKHGNLEYISAHWEEEFGNNRIKSCNASGGWGQMNYYI